MDMKKQGTRGVVRCGRDITSQELESIQETVKLCSGLSRSELAETLCEHLGWVTASGSGKVTACLKMLEELERQGELRLPSKQSRPKTERARGSEHRRRTEPPLEELVARLEDVRPVQLELVEGRDRTKLWNEYVDRHHYLGYRKPFGFCLRYFIASAPGLLGCVLVAGASKAIRVRDAWIGWTPEMRLQNLPWVINNTRLLIFPWVEIRHLASHVLGQLAQRVGDDWSHRWGYRPLLLETFVDPARFSGTCYRAAGWMDLGLTTGQGLARPGCVYTSSPKRIYVKALATDVRQRLSAAPLQGRRLP